MREGTMLSISKGAAIAMMIGLALGAGSTAREPSIR
jgi:hypothetical protein